MQDMASWHCSITTGDGRDPSQMSRVTPSSPSITSRAMISAHLSTASSKNPNFGYPISDKAARETKNLFFALLPEPPYSSQSNAKHPLITGENFLHLASTDMSVRWRGREFSRKRISR
uniref:Uncharacterized protein n=1 Tax=Arundo donax TaxID=35708 RepID=A0A0A9GMI7_ARUDO